MHVVGVQDADIGRVDEMQPTGSELGVDDETVEDVGLLVGEHVLHGADPLVVCAVDVRAGLQRAVGDGCVVHGREDSAQGSVR